MFYRHSLPPRHSSPWTAPPVRKLHRWFHCRSAAPLPKKSRKLNFSGAPYLRPSFPLGAKQFLQNTVCARRRDGFASCPSLLPADNITCLLSPHTQLTVRSRYCRLFCPSQGHKGRCPPSAGEGTDRVLSKSPFYSSKTGPLGAEKQARRGGCGLHKGAY